MSYQSRKAPLLYASPEDVAHLVQQFEAYTLPYERWTHEAHLTVGLWYLLHHERLWATALIREGIRHYNVACGVANTDTSGYHETITLFYIHVISHYLNHSPPDAPLYELANTLIQSPYADRKFPLEFYSRERLFSVDARRHWVEPDVKPLPANAS